VAPGKSDFPGSEHLPTTFAQPENWMALLVIVHPKKKTSAKTSRWGDIRAHEMSALFKKSPFHHSTNYFFQ
jgi:hypothetical protein